MSYIEKERSAGYRFDMEKNARLIRERGISFERIIQFIEGGKVVQIVAHPNQVRYPGQIIYRVDVDGYIHEVPAVRDGGGVFLKTIYPSRKATKALRKEMSNDKEET